MRLPTGKRPIMYCVGCWNWAFLKCRISLRFWDTNLILHQFGRPKARCITRTCFALQVAPMVENLAAAKKITDIRVSRLYLKLFSRAFGNLGKQIWKLEFFFSQARQFRLGFDDKKRIMKLFYEKHGPSGWHEKDQEFGANLTAAINKLYAQRRKKESIRKLAEEFCWFFMLSMKATWRRLLLPTHERGQAALKNPVIIPVIIDVSRIYLTIAPMICYGRFIVPDSAFIATSC